MLKIVDATNRRAVRALLSPERARDAATDRRVAQIVRDVRRDGDNAVLRYARRFPGIAVVPVAVVCWSNTSLMQCDQV